MGSLKGASLELYGDYLISIRLRQDRVLFNRNDNLYQSNEVPEDQIPTRFKRGVDSEVVYGSYDVYPYGSWFQEIMIKEPEAIESWSFDNEEMREVLQRELAEVLSTFNLPFEQYHFFNNRCVGESGPEYLGNAGWRKDRRLHYCAEYRALAQRRWDKLQKFWQENPHLKNLNFENPIPRARDR